MGRPKIYQKGRTSVVFQTDPALLSRLDSAAGEQKITRTEYINRVLLAHLENQGTGDIILAKDKLGEGYCAAHQISVYPGGVMDLSRKVPVVGEIAELHKLSLRFLESA